MKKSLLILFMIFTLFLTSCSNGAGLEGVGKVNIIHDNDINKKILETIKTLDDQVLEDIKNNNTDKILEISSDEFKKNSTNSKELFDNISKVIKDKSFEYQDRYYCENAKIGKLVFSINTTDNLFTIDLEAVSKEMFLSLIKSNSKTDDYMLALLYVKEQDQWKLQTLHYGSYSFDGMNAVDLYEKAKSIDSQGYKVPAAIYLDLSKSILSPAPFIHYKKENEINDYNKQLSEYFKNNNHFPEELKNFNNVKIYGFYAKYIDGSGIIPVIKYVTNTQLNNKEAIEKEANDINSNVTDQYSGMKENFNTFVYEAYSGLPEDPKKTYDCYRTAVKQK